MRLFIAKWLFLSKWLFIAKWLFLASNCEKYFFGYLFHLKIFLGYFCAISNIFWLFLIIFIWSLCQKANKLVVLDISNNRLTSISKRSLVNLNDIEILDLSNNEIYIDQYSGMLTVFSLQKCKQTAVIFFQKSKHVSFFPNL